MLTIELLSGQSPFSREGEDSNQSLISERIQNDPPNIPDSVSAFISFPRQLLIKIFHVDWRGRPRLYSEALGEDSAPTTWL